MPPEQQFVLPNQTPAIPAPQQQVLKIGYAGFWFRFLALVLDGFIISIIIGIPMRVIIALTIVSPSEGLVLEIILICTYFIFLTNKNQATIGKKLLGLRVVSEEGEPLSLGKIVFRETLGKLISVSVLFIGYFMAGFTSKKQALHDKMVGSVVISNPAERKTWVVVISIILVTVLSIIAPVGILSPIILASLNTAREKAKDAAIKVNFSAIRAQAEIVYDMNNNSYATVCKDPEIVRYFTKVEDITKKYMSCNADKTSYAVYIPIKKSSDTTTPATRWWCTDSTGVLGEIEEAPPSLFGTTCYRNQNSSLPKTRI